MTEKKESVKIVIDTQYISPSNFEMKVPTKGDHIRVKRHLGPIPYTHHGIFVSKDEVYHLNGEMDIRKAKYAKPIKTTLNEFLGIDSDKIVNEVEVRVYSKEQEKLRMSIDTIVQNAKSMHEYKIEGYNLFTNNCECFANSCVFFDQLEDRIININLSWQAKIVTEGLKSTFCAAVALYAGYKATKSGNKAATLVGFHRKDKG